VGLLELSWRAAPADIDEARYLLADPFVSALNVALAKARAVADNVSAAEMIVAADTLVVADGELLGKPGDADRARAVLRQLRGRRHLVLTGVLIRTAREQLWGGVVSTRVIMREYADDEIDDYIGRGEPFDKAGGYAIQDSVFRPVENLEGCYLNVVGMPLCAVAAGLRALGVQVNAPHASVPPCGYCRLGADIVSPRSG
jgi:septum formation protein